MEDNKLRITFESYGRKVVIEGPEDANADEFVELCYGGAVALTYMPQNILASMRDYGENMLEAFDYDANVGSNYSKDIE